MVVSVMFITDVDIIVIKFSNTSVVYLSISTTLLLNALLHGIAILKIKGYITFSANNYILVLSALQVIVS